MLEQQRLLDDLGVLLPDIVDVPVWLQLVLVDKKWQDVDDTGCCADL